MSETHSADQTLVNRELSWLSFNARVLQEAEDPTVPLFERLNFLAIYSSNLDEFFRVRVASLRSLLRLGKKKRRKLGMSPDELLRAIHTEVVRQQDRFGMTFREEILPELADRGIHLRTDGTLTPAQEEFSSRYFDETVRSLLTPVLLSDAECPFLEDKHLYLVVELWPEGEISEEEISLVPGAPQVTFQIALVEIPSPPLSRWITLPEEDGKHSVLFLDDLIRRNLDKLFPDHRVGNAYSIKLSRDADLYLDDEFSGDLVEVIRTSLSKRSTGIPARFLYDSRLPSDMLSFLAELYDLQEEDLIVGGRYHNLHDLRDFPNFDQEDGVYPPAPPAPHPSFSDRTPAFELIREKDRILHTPYQSYAPAIRFLEEASEDPAVEEIWITLYRVASDSEVVQALIRAAQSGKRVGAFVEVQARFDEARNLKWAAEMEKAGVRVLYSMPGIKVHAKLALVLRREGGGIRRYALLSTGNFNERTAHVYADHSLFTSDPRITEEVHKVFGFLTGEDASPSFGHLLVAPFTMRESFYQLMDEEADRARMGKEARMVLKMNSLEDPEIIRKLEETVEAGVDTRMIVRGICRLAYPSNNGPRNLEIRSIVDRYLEHARVYVFGASGEERLFLSSADWMTRNLSRRVEVAFPIYDPDVRMELREILDLQLADNVKARHIDRDHLNAFLHRPDEAPTVRTQFAIHDLLQPSGRTVAS